MDYLIEEAKREMKRDGQNKFAKKIAPYAIGVAIVSVIVVSAGFSARYYYRTTQEDATHQYFKAFTTENAKEKEEKLRDIAQKGTTPFSNIANIRLASDGKPTEKPGSAYAVLPSPIRSFAGAPAEAVEAEQFAQLVALYTRLNKADNEEKSRELADDIALAAADRQAIWKHSLKELHAMALLHAGDSAESAAAFLALSTDETAPEGIRARAKELAETLNKDTAVVAKEGKE